MTRRSFLGLLGIGAAGVVVPALVVEPRRRFWQVPSNAPVGAKPLAITSNYEGGVWLFQQQGHTYMPGGEAFALGTSAMSDAAHEALAKDAAHRLMGAIGVEPDRWAQLETMAAFRNERTGEIVTHEEVIKRGLSLTDPTRWPWKSPWTYISKVDVDASRLTITKERA